MDVLYCCATTAIRSYRTNKSTIKTTLKTLSGVIVSNFNRFNCFVIHEFDFHIKNLTWNKLLSRLKHIPIRV